MSGRPHLQVGWDVPGRGGPDVAHGGAPEAEDGVIPQEELVALLGDDEAFTVEDLDRFRRRL